MIKKTFFVLAGILFFQYQSAPSQVISPLNTGSINSTQEKCASAILHDRLLISDPGYAARMAANESEIQAIIDSQKNNHGAKTGSVYTIPVVVHIIHLGEAVGTGTNISTSQIQSAISNLTVAYRNQSPYNGVDVQVEFCLAQRDPSCNSTSGIVRVNGSGTSDYATNGLTTSGTDNEIQIKALSKWPNSTYYNIWVVSEIDGNNGGSGTQGFAYYPGAGPDLDGAVILYNSFGYDPNGSNGYNLKSYTNMNVTAIHELGHAFNLYHTFEGDGTGTACPSGNQCGSTLGDCCSDTPPHKRSQSDCNTAGTNSCDGGSSNLLFVHNFMDYSSDACQTKFTENQKARIRATLDTRRNSLVNSLACSAPSGALPATACIPVVQNVGNYPTGVYGFIFNTLDVSSGNTYADGGNGFVDRTCYFQSNVTAGQSYPVTVKTDTSYNHDVRIYIDYNNDGDFNDANETVFSSDNVFNTHTGNIAILGSPPVTGQVLRMRVYADYYSATITPCANPLYGQAEDFGIKISSGCNPPVVQFSANATTMCAGSAINFTDQTTNSPTSWSWTINGGTPSTSTAKNPNGVIFNTPGTFTIKLVSANACGSDTLTKTNYIIVNQSATANAGTDAVIEADSSYTLSGSRGGSASNSNWTSSGTGSFNNASSLTATYTPSTADKTAGNVTLTLTTNDPAGPCPAASDQMVLTINAASPTTQVCATDCGDTLVYITQTVNNDPVPGATNYEWEWVNTGLSFSFTKLRNSSLTSFDPQWVTGIQCNTTYDVRVRACVGGVWGNFGPVCQITTPKQPTTKVRAPDCGITLDSIGQTIYCDVVVGASDFEWEWVNAGLGFNFTKTRGYNLTNFIPTWVAGLKYGTTYNVRVRVKASGVWGSYGAVCQITTPVFPSTKVRASDCGITISSMGQQLFCDAVPGATNYEWKWVNTVLGFSQSYVRGYNQTDLQPKWIPGLQYGQTYEVQVRAGMGNVWGSFGPVCNISTPPFPTTRVRPADCGTTLTALAQVVYCNAVPGATDYEWEWVNAGLGFSKTYVRGYDLTNFIPSWVVGLKYGKTYDVRVRVKAGGVWGSFGLVCQITTPDFPKTQVRSSDCGISLASLYQQVNCDPVPNASNYEWEWVNTTLGFSKTWKRGNNNTNFVPNWIVGLQLGQTYDVRIRAGVDGVWGSFGPVCQISTPVARFGIFEEDQAGILEISNFENIEMMVYPNPTTGKMNISFYGEASEKEIEIELYDIYGKRIYFHKEMFSLEGIITINEENKYTNGVYLLKVTIGEKTEIRKVLIH